MAQQSTNTLEGSCHCGAIRWEFRTRVDPSDWIIRACQCSFCRAHGARCTSDPDGSVDFSQSDRTFLQKYRFGLKTADFLICRRCGVYIGAAIEVPTGRFATLNLNTMNTDVGDLQTAVPMRYESEDIEDRTERRRARWTPVTSKM